MGRIQVKAIGLLEGNNENSFSVLLEDFENTIRIPILISSIDAQAIALSMESLALDRPVTHQLIINILDIFSAKVAEVFIYNLSEGIFYARLKLITPDDSKEIEIKVSDAICIALRTSAKIFIDTKVANEAGVSISEMQVNGLDQDMPGRPNEESGPQHSKSFEDLLANYSLDELNKQLDEAEMNEEYEKAVKIRDEIKKR